MIVTERRGTNTAAVAKQRLPTGWELFVRGVCGGACVMLVLGRAATLIVGSLTVDSRQSPRARKLSVF